MFIWINGAFGAGKTVTGAELNRRLGGSFVYDPENTGFFLRKNTPPACSSRYPDFQDDPLWRRFNLSLMLDIASSFDGVVIVPMTLTEPDYYRELIGGLREGGVDTRHFVIGANRDILLRRQRSRLDFAGSWAEKKLDHCINALSQPPFEGYIDTSSMTVESVAAEIASRCGLELDPETLGPLGRRLSRLKAQLRVIR